MIAKPSERGHVGSLAAGYCSTFLPRCSRTVNTKIQRDSNDREYPFHQLRSFDCIVTINPYGLTTTLRNKKTDKAVSLAN